MSRQTLPQRELGKSGIKVSAVSLGCMSLSGTYGPSDDAVGIAVIHEALDRGVTMLDSSDLYGAGHNEQLIGKALAGRRDGVIVATKFGNLGGKGGKFADGRPEFVIASCEASLKRLGIDVIDLYYQHSIDLDYMMQISAPHRAKEVFMSEFEAAWKYNTFWQCVFHPFVSGRIPRLDSIMSMVEEMQEKGGVWFVTLEEMASHVRGLIDKGEYKPRVQVMPIFDGRIPDIPNPAAER